MDILYFLSHLDEHLVSLSQQYGYLADLILFLIIFSETGLVIAPLLPGDTLLFVAGAVATGSVLHPAPFNLPLLFVTLSAGAFLGNQVNFQIGRWIGPKVFHWERSVLFNPSHLAEAHAFYELHGGKTIVLARFIPIVRTYAPFVAGIGDMSHSRFALFNAVGALSWVGSLLLAGHWFGNVPFVKGHLTLMILGIIALTLLPVTFAAIRHGLLRRRRRRS